MVVRTPLVVHNRESRASSILAFAVASRSRWCKNLSAPVRVGILRHSITSACSEHKKKMFVGAAQRKIHVRVFWLTTVRAGFDLYIVYVCHLTSICRNYTMKSRWVSRFDLTSEVRMRVFDSLVILSSHYCTRKGTAICLFLLQIVVTRFLITCCGALPVNRSLPIFFYDVSYLNIGRAFFNRDIYTFGHGTCVVCIYIQKVSTIQ